MASLFAQVGASSATGPHFQVSDGTVESTATQAEGASSRSVEIAQWLASDAARPFDGHWVLVNESFDVLASDPSARALVGRHSEQSDPLVLFVLPPNVRFG